MIRSAFTALALLLVRAGGTALAHGDAEWIMRGPDKWCRGPTDCHEVEPATVRYVPGGYEVDWQGQRHLIPEGDAKKATVGYKPWVCEKPDHTIRCLFVPPMGS